MNPNLSHYLLATYEHSEYQRILFGVLKRLHVDYYHPERADFEQEGRLIMAEALCQFERVHVEPTTDRDQTCCLYIYQRLYWRLLDRLRVQQHRSEHIQFSLDQLNDPEREENTANSLLKIFQDPGVERQFCRCETDQFFRTLLGRLTIQQRRYLELLYLGYQPGEIAERLQISKQAVSNLRRRVINSGRALLNGG